MKFTQILLGSILSFAASNALAMPVDNIAIGDIANLEERGKKAKPNKFNFNDFPKSATCAGNTFDKNGLLDAAKAAAKLKLNNNQIGTRHYPHEFHNNGNEITNFNPACGSGFLEFPIIKSKVFDGGSPQIPEAPGADRIVIKFQKEGKKGPVTVTFCGLMTHTGAHNHGAFAECNVED